MTSFIDEVNKERNKRMKMNIQERVSYDLGVAMKSRNKELTSLLRVVVGEFSRLGKELTDEEALKVIKKMRDNAVELKDEFEERELNQYLPTMLEPKEIKELVKHIINMNDFSGMKDMGRVMAEISKNKECTRIDGKTASQIVRDLLSN